MLLTKSKILRNTVVYKYPLHFQVDDDVDETDPEPLVTFPEDGSRAPSEVGSPQPNNAVESLKYEQKTTNNFKKTKVRITSFTNQYNNLLECVQYSLSMLRILMKIFNLIYYGLNRQSSHTKIVKKSLYAQRGHMSFIDGYSAFCLR